MRDVRLNRFRPQVDHSFRNIVERNRSSSRMMSQSRYCLRRIFLTSSYNFMVAMKNCEATCWEKTRCVPLDKMHYYGNGPAWQSRTPGSPLKAKFRFLPKSGRNLGSVQAPCWNGRKGTTRSLSAVPGGIRQRTSTPPFSPGALRGRRPQRN